MTSRRNGSTIACNKWHAYKREERHAPWKFFLPIIGQEPILAVGLDGTCLASLARSWNTVHVHCRQDGDIKWALEHGESLGQIYQFEKLDNLTSTGPKYSAIAVNTDVLKACNPAMVSDLLQPGGCAVWIGTSWNIHRMFGSLKKEFQSVRTYASLPPGAAKILVPLSTSRSALAGLRLFIPVRWRNRFLLQVALATSISGFQKLLGVKQVVVTKKAGQCPESMYLLSWLGELLGCRVWEAAVYSGWRNLTLQLLDSHSKVLCVAKIADNPFGSLATRREINALTRLGTISRIRNYIPKLIATGQWHDHSVEIQEAIGADCRIRSNHTMSTEHIAFLKALAGIDQCEMTIQEWPRWNEIRRWAHEGRLPSEKVRPSILAMINLCSEQFHKTKLPFHRVHGDFTPWHALILKDGLKVIDWEDSEVGLPFNDMVHFLMQGRENVPIESLLHEPLSYLRLSAEQLNFIKTVRYHNHILRIAVLCHIEFGNNDARWLR
jgi:hypothetical protein